MYFQNASENQARGRRALVWVVLPAAVYLVVALLITWPLASRLTTHAAGAGYSDSYEVIRHGWWTREQLLDLEDPFDQPLLVYPDGFRSALMAAQPIQYIEVAALALVVSPLTAFNLALIGTLVLNGMSAYWLGMHLAGRHVLAALLGGLVFMTFPAMQGRVSVGHVSVLTLWALPLLALSLWRVIREGAGWPVALRGGLWFALVTLGSVSAIPYVLFPLFLFAGLYALIAWRGYLFPPGVRWHMQPWARVAGLLLAGGVLIRPFYIPVFADSGASEIESITETGRVAFSTDLLAFASPSPFGPLDDLGLVPDYARDVLATNSAEGAAYLGVVALALAVLALWKRPDMRVWGVVALGAMVFALGALLKWGDVPVVYDLEDWRSYITLPWALFQKLPFFADTRAAGRFNLVVALGLSALVSGGAAMALNALRREGWRVAAAVVLGLLIIGEYQLFWPFLTVDARQPEVFAEIAADDSVRAVFNIPIDNNLTAKTALYQQTLHHKPILAGQAGRRTTQDPAILNVLMAAATGAPGIRDADVPYLFSQTGADRVVVHKYDLQFSVPDVDHVLDRLETLFGPALFEDKWIAVFAVPRTAALPAGFDLAWAEGTSGWAGTVTLGTFTGTMLGDDIRGAGAWYVYAASETAGSLTFATQPYGPARQLRVYLDDHLIAAPLATGESITLDLWLEAGFHRLRFEAVGGCTPYPFTLACLGGDPLAEGCASLETPLCISVALSAPAWSASTALPERERVALGGGLTLRGVQLDVAPDGRQIDAGLFWGASGALPGRYALFVHLTPLEGGEPVLSLTDVPALFTDSWPDRTRWQTRATFDVPDEIAPGRYHLYVGWFDTETGERLAVGGDGPGAESGLLYLAEIAVE